MQNGAFLFVLKKIVALLEQTPNKNAQLCGYHNTRGIWTAG